MVAGSRRRQLFLVERASTSSDTPTLVDVLHVVAVLQRIDELEHLMSPVVGRVYSTEFSPYSTSIAFWRTVSTIESAGYAVTPYHVYVPTFGDWGFPSPSR